MLFPSRAPWKHYAHSPLPPYLLCSTRSTLPRQHTWPWNGHQLSSGALDYCPLASLNPWPPPQHTLWVVLLSQAIAFSKEKNGDTRESCLSGQRWSVFQDMGCTHQGWYSLQPHLPSCLTCWNKSSSALSRSSISCSIMANSLSCSNAIMSLCL